MAENRVVREKRVQERLEKRGFGEDLCGSVFRVGKAPAGSVEL